jgi:hypothetical protein
MGFLTVLEKTFPYVVPKTITDHDTMTGSFADFLHLETPIAAFVQQGEAVAAD